jgi:hypothetical protein
MLDQIAHAPGAGRVRLRGPDRLRPCGELPSSNRAPDSFSAAGKLPFPLPPSASEVGGGAGGDRALRGEAGE